MDIIKSERSFSSEKKLRVLSKVRSRGWKTKKSRQLMPSVMKKRYSGNSVIKRAWLQRIPGPRRDPAGGCGPRRGRSAPAPRP